MIKVAVLLATYNGSRYVKEQINSIKAQQQTDVSIFARDDGSSDGTLDLLRASAVNIIEGAIFNKGAAQNFFNLICLAPIHDFEWVALSDQDDIWMPDKLQRSLQALQKFNSDCYSSSFVSVYEDGSSVYINKSGEIKDFDYIFQSPGPGCTFFINAKVLLKLKDYLMDSVCAANQIKFHDSFIYYFARAAGVRWFIDGAPTVFYRQHANNVLGVNKGFAGVFKRLLMLRSKYFSEQLSLFRGIYGVTGVGAKIIDAVVRFNIFDRFFLIGKAYSFRRDFSGVLGLIFLFIFLKP